MTISPIRRGTEKINGAICLLTDLTELAALQQQIQLKESLAAVGELSAGIAHEFKNALATISGYAQMISAEAGVGEVADSAERILEQTRNITHVVTEFLKYARPLEISSEPVALDGVVERVVSEVAEAMPQVRIRFEGPMGSVAGDEGLLRQAFLNLARNAAEASVGAANGGRVLLRGEVVRHEETYTQRITIFDNGPGIAPANVAEAVSAIFHDQGQGYGTGAGGGAEDHRAARRPSGGAESNGGRGGLYSYATRVPERPGSGRIEEGQHLSKKAGDSRSPRERRYSMTYQELNWFAAAMLLAGLCLATLPALAQQQQSQASPAQQSGDPVADAARKAREQTEGCAEAEKSLYGR